MNLRAERARSDAGKATPQQRLLLRLAARHRLRSVVHARGRCFSVSLDLALDAHKRGLAVTLLRWRGVGEDDFVDHWAVRFDDAQALDPSSSSTVASTRPACSCPPTPGWPCTGGGACPWAFSVRSARPCGAMTLAWHCTVLRCGMRPR